MKKAAILLWAVLAFGCSDEEGGQEKEDNHQWSMQLSEKILSDSKDVYKTETFLFEQQQLLSHSTTQKYMEDEISVQSSFAYTENKAILTNGVNTAIYTLNAEGYASQCVYVAPEQVRRFDFSYSQEGHLTQIKEKIDNVPFSTTDLTYADNDLTSVTTDMENSNAEDTNSAKDTKICTIYQAGDKVNSYHLPCLNILETYPFSMHIDALYAGLLGASPEHFTIRTQPKGNNDEYTTYTYKFDETGKPTEIHSQTTYPGAGFYGSLYPNRRTISISFE